MCGPQLLLWHFLFLLISLSLIIKSKDPKLQKVLNILNGFRVKCQNLPFYWVRDHVMCDQYWWFLELLHVTKNLFPLKKFHPGIVTWLNKNIIKMLEPVFCVWMHVLLIKVLRKLKIGKKFDWQWFGTDIRPSNSKPGINHLPGPPLLMKYSARTQSSPDWGK